MSAEQKTYIEQVFNKKNPPPEMLEKALEKVHDIRKFEIDLYWQRTTYFSVLLGTIFAGFCTKELSLPLQVLLSFIGIIVAWCWYFTNKGSKFWQTNWENHFDFLEDKVIGKIYKINFYDKDIPWWHFRHKILWSGSKYSVSLINQFISLFFSLIWSFIFLYKISKLNLFLLIIVSVGIFLIPFILAWLFKPESIKKEKTTESVEKNTNEKIVDYTLRKTVLGQDLSL